MTNQMNQMNRQQLFNLINTVSFAVDDLRHCRSMQSLELGNRTMAMGRRM